MVCTPGDTWKRGRRQQSALGVFKEGCVQRRYECRPNAQRHQQRERRRGKREGRYVRSDARECDSRSQTKASVGDKETREGWTGLLEKGGFISSFYYITIYPSPGCLK